jgi:hypothetical protein
VCAWSTAQRTVDDFAENAPEAAYREVVAFRERVEQILAAHHRIAQNVERTALHVEGPQRLATPIDTDQQIPDALDFITVPLVGSTFTPDFTMGINFSISLTSACPCTLANPTNQVPQQGGLEIIQDGTGSRTIGTYQGAEKGAIWKK